MVYMRVKYDILNSLNQLQFLSIFDICQEQCQITVHVTQHDTWMKKSVCIKLQLYYNIIHHFIFVFFLFFL